MIPQNLDSRLSVKWLIVIIMAVLNGLVFFNIIPFDLTKLVSLDFLVMFILMLI